MTNNEKLGINVKKSLALKNNWTNFPPLIIIKVVYAWDTANVLRLSYCDLTKIEKTFLISFVSQFTGIFTRSLKNLNFWERTLLFFSLSVVIWKMWMPSSFNLIATNDICSDVYNDSCKCYTFLLYVSNACLGTWPRYNSGSFHDELHRNTLTLDTSCKRKKLERKELQWISAITLHSWHLSFLRSREETSTQKFFEFTAILRSSY